MIFPRQSISNTVNWDKTMMKYFLFLLTFFYLSTGISVQLASSDNDSTNFKCDDFNSKEACEYAESNLLKEDNNGSEKAHAEVKGHQTSIPLKEKKQSAVVNSYNLCEIDPKNKICQTSVKGTKK